MGGLSVVGVPQLYKRCLSRRLMGGRIFEVIVESVPIMIRNIYQCEQ